MPALQRRRAGRRPLLRQLRPRHEPARRAPLDLGPARAEDAALAGLLHDVGKIGVRDAVVTKPDKLTREEAEAMKKKFEEVGAQVEIK